MATKNKTAAKPAAEKFPRKSIPVYAGKTEEEGRANYAALVNSPELAAYRVINGAENKTAVGGGIDVPALIADLRAQGRAVNGGEMRQVEAMLINQATALQSLFARLAERGMSCTGLAQFEADMRLALRSQSQCRATLETLATIRNPPVVFAKQANIANGHQQINNGTAAPSHARENEKEPSKLLEAQHGNYLDTSATGATVGSYKDVETLETLDRAEVGRG